MEKTLFQGLLEQTCYQGRLRPQGPNKPKIDVEPRESSKKILGKPHTAPCGDCHEVVTGRVVEYMMKFDKDHNFRHWQKKCSICREKTVVSRVIDK